MLNSSGYLFFLQKPISYHLVAIMSMVVTRGGSWDWGGEVSSGLGLALVSVVISVASMGNQLKIEQ